MTSGTDTRLSSGVACAQMGDEAVTRAGWWSNIPGCPLSDAKWSKSAQVLLSCCWWWGCSGCIYLELRSRRCWERGCTCSYAEYHTCDWTGTVNREGASLSEPEPFLRRCSTVLNFLLCSLNRSSTWNSFLKLSSSCVCSDWSSVSAAVMKGGRVSPLAPCFGL